MIKKILLIDDDADDRELFTEAILEIAPEMICYTAAHGRNALTLLTNGEIELPDLVFLDINMPIMNGWDFLASIKSHHVYQSLPVIMYSTSSSQSDVDRASGLGALYFLTKPSDFKELKGILQVVIDSLKNKTLPSLSGMFVTATK